jgi:hypothetical protein
MRPIVLLLAACLCVILLYDRLSNPFAAAAVPGSAAQSSQQLSHLEKLQHCLAASQLFEIELAGYRELRKTELNDMVPEVEKAFRDGLSKELQETWDRIHNTYANEEWERNHFRETKTTEKEWRNKEMLKRHFRSFFDSLTDPRTEAAKAWAKHVETLPEEKEIRAQERLVLMFARERDEALAAFNQR